MATLKVYPRGLTEAIEWSLGDSVDAAEFGQKVLDSPAGVALSVPTTTGWVIFEPGVYSAVEIVE